MKKLIVSMMIALASLAASAQTVTLTASSIKTLSGTTFTGKLCMVPANNNGTVLSHFQYGGGGQGVTSQVCYQVTAGALQSGVTVPDTYQTNPQNLCLYTQLIDPSQPLQKRVVGTFPCLQPASSGQNWCSTTGAVITCNLDNYSPSETPGTMQEPDVMGPQGLPGGLPGAIDINTLSGADFGVKLSACLARLSTTYGGICEGRNLGATALTMASSVTISTPNTIINLPCATITTAQQVIVPAGVRNVTIHGCAYQGGSTANGAAGGTVWVYTGSGAAFAVGDSSYAVDTKGFSFDNANLNTASAGAAGSAFYFYRTQEIRLDNLYLNGNQLTGQTAVTLDGTGDYSGGLFQNDTLNGFGTGFLLTGHLSGSVSDDYANASVFNRVRIICPTSSGSPVAGTYGFNVAGADGNTWNGGDVEGCSTAMHLGAAATGNTIVGLRNENSTAQAVADSGSSYNSWITGGTMFTGALTDNGTHNTFLDAFHRQFNSLNGDLWRSQADATVTDHIFTGIGLGNVRGRQVEYQTDVPNAAGSYRNAWLWGPGDGTSGAQAWVLQDLLNNTIRLGIQQNTTAGENNQSFLNAAGTGSVCFNCGANSGTGGVTIGSGGASPTTVASWDSSGNQTLLGGLNFYSGTTQAWQWNCALSGSCSLNNKNATTPARVFAAWTNGGTDIDSQTTNAVTINNTSTGGTGGFLVYEGGANYSTIAFGVSGAGATNQAGNHQTGSASGTGNEIIGNHLNQIATADFAGTCTMSSSATCTVSFQHSWTSIPDCHVTPIVSAAPTNYAGYSWSTNVVTVWANASNSLTWSVVCVGNPN